MDSRHVDIARPINGHAERAIEDIAPAIACVVNDCRNDLGGSRGGTAYPAEDSQEEKEENAGHAGRPTKRTRETQGGEAQ